MIRDLEQHIKHKTETVWLRYAGTTGNDPAQRATSDLNSARHLWSNVMSLVEGKTVEVWRWTCEYRCTGTLLTIQCRSLSQ